MLFITVQTQLLLSCTHLLCRALTKEELHPSYAAAFDLGIWPSSLSTPTGLPDGFVCEQAIEMSFDGKVESCYVCIMRKEVDASRMRSEALASFSPIHRLGPLWMLSV